VGAGLTKQWSRRGEIPARFLGLNPPRGSSLSLYGEAMNKLERAILVLAIIAPLAMVTIGTRFDGLFGWLAFLAFLSNVAAVFLIFRDLYRREFEDRNAKLKWALWMFFTSGLAMVVYVFKHALQPRAEARRA
jgi:hypothetical protein